MTVDLKIIEMIAFFGSFLLFSSLSLLTVVAVAAAVVVDGTLKKKRKLGFLKVKQN